jgi:hypothetical protein
MGEANAEEWQTTGQSAVLVGHEAFFSGSRLAVREYQLANQRPTFSTQCRCPSIPHHPTQRRRQGRPPMALLRPPAGRAGSRRAGLHEAWDAPTAPPRGGA